MLAAEEHDVIIVDRVGDVPKPRYCIHARVTCCVCRQWCWAGRNSLAMLDTRLVLPLCKPCADIYVPKHAKAELNVNDAGAHD